MKNDTSDALNRIAEKINPFSEPYSDANIGHVGCVVEGQIATAKGLFAIAASIDNLADAIRFGKDGES